MTNINVGGTASFRIGDILERALWTGMQTGLGTLPTVLGVIGAVGSGPLGTATSSAATGKAAVAAGLAAAIATLLSLVKNALAVYRPLLASGNLLQRFLWTFVFAAVAALPTGEVYLNLAFGRTALLAAVSAGIAAVVSLAKNLTAEGVLVQATVRASGRSVSNIP